MFRTSSGQTGFDAYIFEAQAIANAQRELNTRFVQLCQIIKEEKPEAFENSTDFLYSTASSSQYFTNYLIRRRNEVAK